MKKGDGRLRGHLLRDHVISIASDNEEVGAGMVEPVNMLPEDVMNGSPIVGGAEGFKFVKVGLHEDERGAVQAAKGRGG